jgi:hypothetical protein
MKKRKPKKISIESIKQRLLWPRLQMSVILSLTAISAFAVSVLLLAAGVESMPLRYALAVAVAYGVFLLLLKMWLSIGDLEPGIPKIDIPIPVGSGGSSVSGSSQVFGGGGDFAGAGAGGSWGEPSGVSFASSDVSAPSGGGSVDLDLDEFALIAVAVVIAMGGLIAVFYVVYVAPALFAEITLDALVAGGLYKATKKIEGPNWLRTAVRKTIIPAAISLVLFAGAGYVLQGVYPHARTIGEVWRTMGSE